MRLLRIGKRMWYDNRQLKEEEQLVSYKCNDGRFDKVIAGNCEELETL